MCARGRVLPMSFPPEYFLSIKCHSTVIHAAGVIESPSDADSFSFVTDGGNWNFIVRTASATPNLSGYLILTSSAGSTIAISLLGSASVLHADLTAGMYHLTILSDGQYGSVGQYALDAST